jgi:hypothetical protein
MSNETSKEELLDVGRKLALVSRKDKALYERVKRIAKMRGETLQEVLATGFELYELYSTLEGLDPKALAIAIRLVEHFYERAIETMVKLGGLLTSDYIRSNLAIASELAKSMSETTPQQSTQSTQSPDQLMKQLQYNMLLNMITPIYTMLINLLASLGGVKTPLPQLPITQQQSTKPTFIVEE